VSTVCAYATFLIAEDLLHLSGVMAVLASGLMVGVFSRKYKTEMTEKFWDFLAYIAESMIFLLAGITITLSMFADRWLAIIIGIIAILVARIIMIFGTFPILKLLPGIDAVPLKQQAVLAWGGVRGTVTLALALSLPLTLEYWYTIQSIAYGVVLFTLFVQATTMGPLIRKLDIA
jgi:Na+:H+ antiporter